MAAVKKCVRIKRRDCTEGMFTCSMISLKKSLFVIKLLNAENGDVEMKHTHTHAQTISDIIFGTVKNCLSTNLISR